MANRKIKLEELVARRDALRSEVERLKSESNSNGVRSIEEQTTIARLLGEARELDHDIDTYVAQNKEGSRMNKITSYVKSHKSEFIFGTAIVAVASATIYFSVTKRIDFLMVVQNNSKAPRPVVLPLSVAKELIEFWDAGHPENTILSATEMLKG